MEQKNKSLIMWICLIFVLVVVLIPHIRYSIFGGREPTEDEKKLLLIAIENENYELCGKIPNYSRVKPGYWSYEPCYHLRNRCYLEIAKKTKNYQLCEFITDNSCSFMDSPYECYSDFYYQRKKEVEQGKETVSSICASLGSAKERCTKYIQEHIQIISE